MESEAINAAGQMDFGLVALFIRSSFIVKIVMVILIVASIWAWSIVIAKMRQYRAARLEADNFSQMFWSGQPLEDIYSKVGPHPDGDMERIFVSGMKEWRKSHFKDGQVMPGANVRIERAMNVTINSSRDLWENGLMVLASVGSTAPFIGLFGTVWGIKNSFQDIATSQSTNLAVVAPGIAEALVATALGLVAAIPAVIFYNKLTSDAERLAIDHEAFADEFSLLLSRQIDQERG